MNIYRLDPIDPGHSSWKNSTEKDTVWAGAPTAQEARALVAAKTELAPDEDSPWRNARASSCVLEPTMWQVGPGAVVRQDGSAVGD